MKNPCRIKNLPNPNSTPETASKSYVDNKFEDTSIIKSTAHVGLNNKNLDNVHFVKVTSMPAVGDHFTSKYYVDQAFSEIVR